MWLCEVVFQGVFGLDRPAKVRVDPGFCSLALPEGASAADFRTLILSLLYPHHVGASELRALVNQQSTTVRLGLVVDPVGDGARTYKVYRRLEDDSVALQNAQGGERGKEIARGHLEVGRALEKRLNLPPFKTFLLLNCWSPPRSAPSPPRKAAAGKRPSGGGKASDVERLLGMLDVARRVEAVDVQLDTLQADLGEFKRKNKNLEKQLKRVEVRQARISQIRQALSLSADERTLLTGYKERQGSFDRRNQSLNAEIEVTREQQASARPGPLLKDYILVSCVSLALVLFIISAAVDLRPLALVNILLLGAAAWTLSRRYEQLEQAHVLNIRVEQIFRHLETLQQERADHERDYKRLLVRTNLKDASEFESLQSELDELELGVDGLDDDLEEKAHKARAEDARLTGLIADLNAQKDEIGEVNLPVYEIENQLTGLGVDTYGLGADPLAPVDVAMSGASPPPFFAALRVAAEEMGLFRDGELKDKALGSWRKMATHALGQDWAEASLDDEGYLRRGGDEALEAQAAGLLAAGLLASLPDEQARCRFLCLTSPYAGLSDKGRHKLDKIFNFLGKSGQVLVLE